MIKTPLTLSRIRQFPFAALFLSAFCGVLLMGGCVEPEQAAVPECPGAMEYCSGACVEVISSAIHCGRCSSSCPGNKVCSSGECRDECGPGESLCGQECANKLNNTDHCGDCFNKCADGEICSNQECVCPAGQACGQALATGGAASGGSGSATGTGGATGGAVGTGGAMPTGGAQNTGGTLTGGTTSSGGAGGGAQVTCTDNLPTGTDWPEATCADWMAEGHCEDGWLIDQGACETTCGRCIASGGTGGSGSATASGGALGYGAGNPWGGVTAGQEGWTSRYWDCCKQSCGWTGNTGGNPVRSCDASGASQVGPDDQSACSGGGATTCNSFTPWAYSDEVSFGFVATHAGSGQPCGQCYHLEFTGQGQHNGNDPGSQAIAGKTMIVMATNIGGDVSGDGQMDLLLPGGGTGMFYGCGTAWGVQEGSPELGQQYGGLRSDCTGGDLASVKSCVADKCQQLFGSRGLTDMYDGCMWYVNWMQAADNPKFRMEPIDCPDEIRSVAY